MLIRTLSSLCSINPESLAADTPAAFTFDYVDISSVARGRISWSDVRRMAFRDAPSRARRRLRSGDVLLCTVRPALKSHTRIPDENGVPRVGSTGFATLRPFVTSDSSYLFHQLFSDQVAAQLRALETGSNYPAVNERDVSRLLVFTPVEDERARIAAVLDAVDAAIEKTEAVIAKLKLVRAGLLHDLLTRGIDHNGELRDPAAHPEQFKDFPVGMFPSEWALGEIDQMAINCDAQRKPVKQADRDGQREIYPYYGASGVIDYVGGFLFDGEYVLVAEDGENLRSRELPVAFAAYGKFWVNNHAHILKPRLGTDVRFLETLLESQNYKPWLIGSAQPKLTQQGLSRIRLMIPNPYEQRMIADLMQLFDERVRSEITEFKKLDDLRRGINADLLTGRVRVPADMNTGGA